ncbi:hypothetical protein ACFO0N_14915 [Halobium salinum]|uniref:Uncharacterized protein n=1 Tax=Halobium salinum TaxID=1364940 RepID=A0ABD5PE77_9EURY|nr:hypothetical protein [Halobium salinum]
MADSYSAVVDFLQERGIAVTPEAEEYAHRYSSKFLYTIEGVTEEDAERIQTISVLRGAEAAVTNSMDLQVNDGGYQESLQLNSDHLRVAAITSLNNCILTPPCLDGPEELNKVPYLTVFSGDAERIRNLGVEDAVALTEYDIEEFSEIYTESYELNTNQLESWTQLKIDIWFELSDQISELI